MSGVSAATAPAPTAGIDSPGRLALRALLSRPTAVFGGAVLIGVIVLALFAPWIAPYDPLATSWSLVRKAPSAAHWLGTDEVGRDLLSRIIWGARASLSAGVIAVAIAVGVGVPTGMVAG
jgi:peptide/nickel transport system permease protein